MPSSVEVLAASTVAPRGKSWPEVVRNLVELDEDELGTDWRLQESDRAPLRFSGPEDVISE
jgi:hypothetical protein